MRAPRHSEERRSSAMEPITISRERSRKVVAVPNNSNGNNNYEFLEAVSSSCENFSGKTPRSRPQRQPRRTVRLRRTPGTLVAKGAASLQPADHLRRELQLSPTPPPPDRAWASTSTGGRRGHERWRADVTWTEAVPAVYRARGSGGGCATPDTIAALGGYVITPPPDRCEN